MKAELERLSDAFPPGSEEQNPKLKARVHKIFGNNGNLEFDLKKVEFRTSLDTELLEQLKILHKEWFPVTYGDEFWSEIARGSLRLFLAIYPGEFLDSKTESDYIIGAIVYKVCDPKREYLTFFDYISLFIKKYMAIHIYTLGVAKSLRRKGIGDLLMREFFSFINDDMEERVSLIHLDVVEYNNSALLYYRKHGFRQLKYFPHHYNLFGKYYGCSRMVLYLNRFKAPHNLN